MIGLDLGITAAVGCIQTPGQSPLVEIRQTITVRAESANRFLNK